jgi:ABC-type transporter Mla subunit MlaD
MNTVVVAVALSAVLLFYWRAALVILAVILLGLLLVGIAMVVGDLSPVTRHQQAVTPKPTVSATSSAASRLAPSSRVPSHGRAGAGRAA